MKTTTIPLVITPEAEAYIDELELRQPFEQIIDHIRQTIPGLHEIDVVREPPYDTGGDDILLIRGYREPSGLEDDPTDRNFGRWRVTTFSHQVFKYFVFYSVEEPRNAG